MQHQNILRVIIVEIDRFFDWKYPVIEDGKPTKYNWVVQNLDGFKLGFKTDIGAFSYINAKKGVTIEQLHETFKIASKDKGKAMLDKYIKENPE